MKWQGTVWPKDVNRVCRPKRSKKTSLPTRTYSEQRTGRRVQSTSPECPTRRNTNVTTENEWKTQWQEQVLRLASANLVSSSYHSMLCSPWFLLHGPFQVSNLIVFFGMCSIFCQFGSPVVTQDCVNSSLQYLTSISSRDLGSFGSDRIFLHDCISSCLSDLRCSMLPGKASQLQSERNSDSRWMKAPRSGAGPSWVHLLNVSSIQTSSQ